MSDNVPVFVNLEVRNEDDDTHVVARYCFGRMYSGSDSCANGNANPTHGNIHPTNRNPYEHARANSYANA
jgi:hypothetical protein